MKGLALVLLLAAGCGLDDPYQQTLWLRKQWAAAVVDGSMECRELLGVGPKAGCKFYREKLECQCSWVETAADAIGRGWHDHWVTVRFNSCDALDALPKWQADVIFLDHDPAEVARTLLP